MTIMTIKIIREDDDDMTMAIIWIYLPCRHFDKELSLPSSTSVGPFFLALAAQQHTLEASRKGAHQSFVSHL